jgi:hypothetical protein
MGFLDGLRKAFSGGTAAPSASWTYARCRRCGEPLKARIDMRNELSLADDGENFIVRKGLVGTGRKRCFQTVEVTLTFGSDRRTLREQSAEGGEIISQAEYERLLALPAEPTD